MTGSRSGRRERTADQPATRVAGRGAGRSRGACRPGCRRCRSLARSTARCRRSDRRSAPRSVSRLPACRARRSRWRGRAALPMNCPDCRSRPAPRHRPPSRRRRSDRRLPMTSRRGRTERHPAAGRRSFGRSAAAQPQDGRACRRAQADPVLAAGPFRAASAPPPRGARPRRSSREAASRHDTRRGDKGQGDAARPQRDGEAQRPAGKQHFERNSAASPANATANAKTARRPIAARSPTAREWRPKAAARKTGYQGGGKSWSTQKPREERPARVDPRSPFAKLAALRDQLKK